MEEWLKQRLVGASVLVLLAVIFIPVLLEYSYEPGEVGIDPPPVPAGAEDDEFSSRVLALDESPSPLPASRAAPAGAGSRDEGDPGAMAMDGGRAVDEEPGSPAAVAALSPSVESPEPTPTPTPTPTPAGEGEAKEDDSAPPPLPSAEPATGEQEGAASPPAAAWAAQLGSFADRRNAIVLRNRLRAEGYPAFMTSISTEGGKVTRVLVGPEPTREGTVSTIESLRRETGLDGFVVRYPRG